MSLDMSSWDIEGIGAAERGCSVKTAADSVLEFEAPSRPDVLSSLRSRVAGFAGKMPFSEDDLEDIKLAVGEACTNAIRHGRNSECGHIIVRVELQPDAVRITISDHGCGFDPASVKITATGSLIQSGRGILLMRTFMDEVNIHFGNPGTSVELIKRVRNQHAT